MVQEKREQGGLDALELKNTEAPLGGRISRTDLRRRLKLLHQPTTAMYSSIESCFAPSLLSEKSQNAHKESYSASTPYRHAVVDGLLDQELLKKAREEIIEELRFAEKETDIYKVSKRERIPLFHSLYIGKALLIHSTLLYCVLLQVNQTGDLANLDGLPTEEAKRLNHLLKVRNAIYSKEFRNWLQAVTGCGPLSEKKKDMSINDYTRGCHLLNHE